MLVLGTISDWEAFWASYRDVQHMYVCVYVKHIVFSDLSNLIHVVVINSILLLPNFPINVNIIIYSFCFDGNLDCKQCCWECLVYMHWCTVFLG